MAVSQYQDKLAAVLNQPGFVSDIFKAAEQKTGVQRIYIAYGAISLTILWLAFGFGAQLLSNLIGFVYPAYCSIKALETLNKQDDKKWLTYWVVFAFFSVLEFFADILVGWVPFYWLVKCLFMIWCMAPMENNGSEIIYSRFIRPVFMKHQTKIDELMNKAATQAGDLLNKAVEKGKDLAAESQLNKNKGD